MEYLRRGYTLSWPEEMVQAGKDRVAKIKSGLCWAAGTKMSKYSDGKGGDSKDLRGGKRVWEAINPTEKRENM